jgi:hypothetical protein
MGLRLPRFRLIVQITAAIALAFWWGGLTFYSLVAVPIGADVLGGNAEQGFITRLVTRWINISGAATLLVLVGSTCALWRCAGLRSRIILAITWATMAVAQTTLFVLHPRLDAMLDVPGHSLSDPSVFYSLHQFYLTVTGVQWFAGLVYFITLLACWRE